MLRFHKSPIFNPPLYASPPIWPTFEDTTKLIASALPLKKPLPTEELIPVSVKDLAGAMWSDARGGLSQLACEGICESLLETYDDGMRSRASLGRLPDSYRRITSELLSTAASLAGMNRGSPCYFVAKRLFNEIASQYRWMRRWPGKGPDYLVCNPGELSVFFMEVKGVERPVLKRPPDFVNNKAQSLNARLRCEEADEDADIDGYILSYCTVSPTKGLTVRWFNYRNEVARREEHTYVILITALAQFIDHLRSAGFEDFAEAVKFWRDPFEVHGPILALFSFSGDDQLWLANEGPVRLGIERKAMITFIKISAWNKRERDASNEAAYDSRYDPSVLLADLQDLAVAQLNERSGLRQMFRLPTGISFWSADTYAGLKPD